MKATLQDLGPYVRAQRVHRDWSQDDLAAKAACGRTAVAHLEQARRLPNPEALRAICETLDLPRTFWEALLSNDEVQRAHFEDALTELVGRQVSLQLHDEHSQEVAHSTVIGMFNSGRTARQLFDLFCATMVHYDVPSPSFKFFERYLGTRAFFSPKAFEEQVQRYQVEAIRIYSSLAAAYEGLSGAADLDAMLAPIAKRSDETYRARTEWSDIERIPDERLADLGYISAARAEKEHRERKWLSDFLREIAPEIAKGGALALARHSAKKRRKAGSLLRSFKSSLPHDLMSPLFVQTTDEDRILREATRLAPKEARDIERMGETQASGLRNLARYLAADMMDVYVATSMRSDADFASANAFVRRLFDHELVHPLKLRYFNPTQSWIEDRVAKGLVEALMLKRADATVYLAQKTDSFGKDSEASVALGQGKPVIVYVPALRVRAVELDTERLGLLARADLTRIVQQEADGEDREVDETTDDLALFSQVVSLRLSRVSEPDLTAAVREHWADFDLYGEDQRIENPELRARYRSWLDDVVHSKPLGELPEDLRAQIVGILVATATNFERRATVFREVHPLALQVILSTGVLNGIIVVRSIDGCASILARLVRNDLELQLEVDDANYRLVERTTRSTIRVIARHTLVSHAFAAYYKMRRE